MRVLTQDQQEAVVTVGSNRFRIGNFVIECWSLAEERYFAVARRDWQKREYLIDGSPAVSDEFLLILV